ncbi:hypothetical protein PAMA_008329 [Pampus argenteus]
MSLFVNRWIFVSSLAVVMLLSVLPDSFGRLVNFPCCYEVRFSLQGRIKTCYEMKPQEDGCVHSFLIENMRGNQKCIDPASTWLKEKLEKKQITCVPYFSSSDVLNDRAA